MITLEMNLHNLALSQNGVHTFNSLGVLGDTPYLCNSSGLFSLFDSNTHDTGIGITSLFEIYFDTQAQCRIRYIYLSGEFSGSIKLTLTSNDNVSRSYTKAPFTTSNKQHSFRIPIDRDNGRGRWWKLKFENQSGSDYSLDEIAIVPIYQEVYYE